MIKTIDGMVNKYKMKLNKLIIKKIIMIKILKKEKFQMTIYQLVQNRNTNRQKRKNDQIQKNQNQITRSEAGAGKI